MKTLLPSSLALAARRVLAAAALALLPAIPAARAQQTAPPAPARATPPKVVLKLDDMIGLQPQWQKVLDMVNKRGIKASFGIICNSLEKPNPAYFQWIKDTQAKGNIEFWCHGYDHKDWAENGQHFMEFQGPTYEQQKEHLQKCQALAKEKLGFAFASFGAPFNATDEKTAQVLRDDVPDFKVWMYGDAQFPEGKTVLARYGDVNIENPIFHPSTDRLAAGMAKHAAAPYFVIQGHPPQWDAPRLAEFEKMLDYLISQKAVFVTPSELAASLPPPKPGGTLPPPTKLGVAAAPTGAAPAKPLPAGTPTGGNLVNNGDFARGMEDWNLQHMEDANADATVDDDGAGKKALHVKVTTAGSKRYFVQFATRTPFALAEGKTYTLSFRARSTPASSIVVVVPKVGGAFEALARQDGVALKEEWSDYSYTIAPTHGADTAGLLISGLAAVAGDYWFTDISLKVNQ